MLSGQWTVPRPEALSQAPGAVISTRSHLISLIPRDRGPTLLPPFTGAEADNSSQ